MSDSNMRDYFPFPSKIFALMLANSPRPIVSNAWQRVTLLIFMRCVSEILTYC